MKTTLVSRLISNGEKRSWSIQTYFGSETNPNTGKRKHIKETSVLNIYTFTNPKTNHEVEHNKICQQNLDIILKNLQEDILKNESVFSDKKYLNKKIRAFKEAAFDKLNVDLKRKGFNDLMKFLENLSDDIKIEIFNDVIGKIKFLATKL